MEPGNNKWSGPAKVTGVEGTKVRIIHCGYDRTVPNCRVQPYKTEKIIVENPESNIDTVEISEKYNINKTKDDGECKEELKSPNILTRPKRYQYVKYKIDGEEKYGLIIKVGKSSGKDRNKCWIKNGEN